MDFNEDELSFSYADGPQDAGSPWNPMAPEAYSQPLVPTPPSPDTSRRTKDTGSTGIYYNERAGQPSSPPLQRQIQQQLQMEHFPTYMLPQQDARPNAGDQKYSGPDTMMEDAFDGEKELDGISRYISRAFSPSLFQPGTPPIPNSFGGQNNMQAQQIPQYFYQQQYQQQHQNQTHRPAQQNLNYKSETLQASIRSPSSFPAVDSGNTSSFGEASTRSVDAEEFQRARIDESTRHQQQLQDLHEYYKAELDAARKSSASGENNNASALSQIARLEDMLREQAADFASKQTEMERVIDEQKAQIDELKRSTKDFAIERTKLVEDVREAQTVKETLEKDLVKDRNEALRVMENQMRNNEDKLRLDIKRETDLRRRHEAEASRANAMCRKIEADLENCRKTLSSKEKRLSHVEAALDKEKQTVKDLTRQAQLDKVTLQQTLNENAVLMQSQRKFQQATDDAIRSKNHAEQSEARLLDENERLHGENKELRQRNGQLQKSADRMRKEERHIAGQHSPIQEAERNRNHSTAGVASNPHQGPHISTAYSTNHLQQRERSHPQTTMQYQTRKPIKRADQVNLLGGNLPEKQSKSSSSTSRLHAREMTDKPQYGRNQYQNYSKQSQKPAPQHTHVTSQNELQSPKGSRISFTSIPTTMNNPDVFATTPSADNYTSNKMSFEEAMMRAKSQQAAAPPAAQSAIMPAAPSSEKAIGSSSNGATSAESNPAYEWSMMSSTYGTQARMERGNGHTQTTVSPTVAAHINEARQRRSQFKIKDPDAARPVSKDMVKKVREDRFQRSASAPFATAESLRVKLESSASIQDKLMRLGMERTQLEADIIRLEPKSKKRIDARRQKDQIEFRLGEIRKESMKLRKQLREMGM